MYIKHWQLLLGLCWGRKQVQTADETTGTVHTAHITSTCSMTKWKGRESVYCIYMQAPPLLLLLLLNDEKKRELE